MVETPPWFALLSCWVEPRAQISHRSCFSHNKNLPNAFLGCVSPHFSICCYRHILSQHHTHWCHSLHLILHSVFPSAFPLAQPCSWPANMSPPGDNTATGKCFSHSFRCLFLCWMRPRAFVIVAVFIFNRLILWGQESWHRLTTWKRKLSSYSKGIEIAENLKGLAGINSVLLLQRIIIIKKRKKWPWRIWRN